MTTTTATDATTIDPIDHGEATGLAEHQYRRFAEMLAQIAEHQWDAPTDCDGWTVRDLAGHMLGAMRSAASMGELIRQQRVIRRRAKRTGENPIDVMTALQIELTADLTPEELVAETAALATPAARGRQRTPALVRRLARIPVEIGSLTETWTVGYLVDVILTRDTFMHRIDLSRATHVELDLDHDDRRLVADIVAEWARRHGRPFDLHLTGSAGGRYHSPGGGERIEIDAVEFCRTLSGRATGAGLLTQDVPF